ncbi:MAG: hypothetical protein N2652_08930 [Kiritimatiellae bacterium]|nr:hypothetical protein [Kiritimatiellia bacterium]
METIRINLLRGQVPSRAERVRLFYLMLGYLLLTGTVLVVLLSQQTRVVLRLRAQQRVLDAQERWFRRQYPQFGRLAEFADDVRMGLSHCRSQLAAIERTLQQRADLAPLFIALTEPMLPGMRLTMVALDREKKSLSFEVAVPAATFDRRSAQGEGDLIAAWNANPVVRARLRSVALIGTRRARGPTGFEYVLSFGGVLRERGSAATAPGMESS